MEPSGRKRPHLLVLEAALATARLGASLAGDLSHRLVRVSAVSESLLPHVARIVRERWINTRCERDATVNVIDHRKDGVEPAMTGMLGEAKVGDSAEVDLDTPLELG